MGHDGVHKGHPGQRPVRPEGHVAQRVHAHTCICMAATCTMFESVRYCEVHVHVSMMMATRINGWIGEGANDHVWITCQL